MSTPAFRPLAVLAAFGTAAAALPLTIGMAIGPPAANGGGAPVLAAYERAASTVNASGCELPAWLLAGIGDVESNHGTTGGHTVGPDGTVTPPLVGPHVQGLADTDHGKWDGLIGEDRAVGPMQLLPSTWASVVGDGNGDGIADPQNLFDAALAAATYLCQSAPPMATEADWRRGLLAYNHSTAYVERILALRGRYDQPADTSVWIVDVPGIGPTSSQWAGQVRALLAAAAADGLELTGRSYRDRAAQVLLRRQHCGSSTYATYSMPAGECHPPTARPGTSMHEQGLAVDFDDCHHDSACFRWLATHAARWGIFNLPSEPWHWSATGS